MAKRKTLAVQGAKKLWIPASVGMTDNKICENLRKSAVKINRKPAVIRLRQDYGGQEPQAKYKRISVNQRNQRLDSIY
jgi:hypothetical protein